MYHHPGEYVTDFCVVRRGDTYHLFHIRGELGAWTQGYSVNEIDLGHAVSTDLRLWTPCEPVLPSDRQRGWDSHGTYAPDVVEVDGTYYMYYTGVDADNNQGIGLALSRDLYHWEKHPGNPIVQAGPWSNRRQGRNVAGRDAMVFADAKRGRYLMYYTATMADGRACIALAESTDLVAWADRGPTYVEDDRSYNRCESAYLVEHDSRYYLFYSAKGGPNSKGFRPSDFAHFDVVYLVSDDPTGGWRKPENHALIVGSTCASEHPTFDGQTYMLYVVQREIQGLWGASVLSDPKRVTWTPEGLVRVEEHLPPNVERRRLFSSRDGSYGEWVSRGGGWQVEGGELRHSAAGEAATAAHADSYLTHTLWGGDLAIEAEVRASGGGCASLVVRGNPSALAGYRVSLDFDRSTVGFYRRVPGQLDEPIQERRVPLAADRWHRLKVVAQAEFFDVYVDDALAIVRDAHTYASGCFGLHARGAVSFRGVEAYEYRGPPSPTGDNWERRCRPRQWFPRG